MNYIQLMHIPKVNYTFRLSEEVIQKLDNFDKNVDRTRVSKISYLVRLVDAINPTKLTIIENISQHPRKHRSGSHLPEDVVDIIQKFIKRENATAISVLETMIIEGIRYSKTYSLEVKLTKRK